MSQERPDHNRDNLLKRQIEEILKKTEAKPPVFNPRELMFVLTGVAFAVLGNVLLHAGSPGYYRLENSFMIGAFTIGVGYLGYLTARGVRACIKSHFT